MRKIALALVSIALLIGFSSCKKQQEKSFPLTLNINFEPSKLKDAYVIKAKYSWTPKKDFKLSNDYWVFVHFWDPSTKTMYLQDDHKPSVPFSKWEQGKKITYERILVLPEYIEEITKKSFPIDITIGVYNPKKKDKIIIFKKRVNIEINPEVVPQIIYGQGWYSEEFDKNGNTWRWMGKQAVCRVENPKKTSILYISGSLPKSFLPDQKIRIYINDKVIDEFSNAEFEKVYKLDSSILGNNEEFELKIMADKSFIPKKVYKNSQDERELSASIKKIFFCVQ